jgi:hypothetical protein
MPSPLQQSLQLNTQVVDLENSTLMILFPSLSSPLHLGLKKLTKPPSGSGSIGIKMSPNLGIRLGVIIIK